MRINSGRITWGLFTRLHVVVISYSVEHLSPFEFIIVPPPDKVYPPTLSVSVIFRLIVSPRVTFIPAIEIF